MSDNFVDPNIIQRFLFIISDIINDKIANSDAAGPKYQKLDKIVKIRPDKLSGLTPEESTRILRTEHELLSLNYATSPDVAYELFSNNTTDASRNFGYVVSHNILINLPANGQQQLYYFNIDKLNRTNARGENRQFFIRKINIINKSKDIFTTNSNYQVTLDINFKEFDNLLDDLVEVESIDIPGLKKQIPLIKILYKFFDKNQEQLSVGDIEARDPDGIYLNQVITFTDKDKFGKIIGELGTDELHRTFHLTYYKHEFNVFKSEETILKEYENDLVVDYISYEADPTPKVGRDEKQVPSTTDNLYALLKNEKVINQIKTGANMPILFNIVEYLKQISENSKKVAELKLKINCSQLYASLKDKPEQQIKLEAYKNEADNLESYREQIKKINVDIENIKFEINRSLILYILGNCNIYKATVPYYLLNTFERRNFKENLEKGWGEALGVVIESTVAGGTFGGGAGALVGAGASLGYEAYKFATTGVIKTHQLDIQQIRSVIGQENTLAISTSENGYSYLVKKDNEASGAAKEKSYRDQPGAGAVGGDISVLGVASTDVAITAGKGALSIGRQADEIALKNTQNLLNTAAGLAVQDEDTKAMADIEFVLFGDLLKILTDIDSEITLVVGGKTILQDALTGTSAYVNLCHMPIYLNGVTKFLKENLLDKNHNFHYSVDTFIRDLHEKLLKNALKQGDGISSETYKQYIPENIRMQSSVHLQGVDYSNIKKLTGDGGGIQMLASAESTQIRDYKLNFVKSKNIFNKTSGNKKLAKIFTLASDQEIKYYDFYKGYREWVRKKQLSESFKRDGKLYSGKDFQEYIIREHMIPCVPTRYSANDETILKKKNVSFTRMDNANMTVGNILDGKPIYRLPYNFKSDFQVFMSFFSDIGGLVFISPPDVQLETNMNTFGFGGLYILAESNVEYHFQRLEKNNLTLPNEESSYRLGGYMISHGDAVKTKANTQQSQIQKCTDPVPVTSEPAKQ
jgi:hypothetical protein